jgi:beta-galactosidase/beta-glucuronidase
MKCELVCTGVIGDPLYELNFINNGKPPVWDTSDWVYTTLFDLQSDISLSSPSLVFDGVKMAANAYLNGVYLGSFIDQFLRYNWPVASILKATGNNLTIEFTTSADAQNAEGRWMSCTGGWVRSSPPV